MVPSVFADEQLRSECGATSRDSGLHGPDRDVEGFGDLGIVEVCDVAQDHGNPEVLGELIECGVEDESVGKRFGVPVGSRIDRFGSIILTDHVERRTTLPLSQLVERCVRGDAVGPGAERRPPVETGKAAHDLDQCFLAGVVGVARAPGNSSTHGVDAVVVATQQLVERELIAALSGGDQSSVVEVAGNERSVPNGPWT